MRELVTHKCGCAQALSLGCDLEFVSLCGREGAGPRQRSGNAGKKVGRATAESLQPPGSASAVEWRVGGRLAEGISALLACWRMR